MNTFANHPMRTHFAAEKFSLSGCKNQFLSGEKPPTAADNDNLGIRPANIVPTIDYVYSYGHIRAEFPTIGLKKEFERYLICTGEDGTARQFIPQNRQALVRALKLEKNLESLLFEALSKPHNRYIARQMRWTLFDDFGNDVYHLTPNESQLNSLIAAIEPRPTDGAKDSQAGGIDKTQQLHRTVMLLGSVSKDMADDVVNPHGLPNLSIRKVESASPAFIIEVIKSKAPEIKEQPLKQIVAEILSLGDNDGDNDKERALNYILFHNLAIYTHSYHIMFEGDTSSDKPSARLSNVQVLTQISGSRVIGKVVFEFQNSTGGAGQSWYCAVDVTDENPFLLVDFRPYLPRYG